MLLVTMPVLVGNSINVPLLWHSASTFLLCCDAFSDCFSADGGVIHLVGCVLHVCCVCACVRAVTL